MGKKGNGTKARNKASSQQAKHRPHHHHDTSNQVIKRAGLQRREHSQSTGRQLQGGKSTGCTASSIQGYDGTAKSSNGRGKSNDNSNSNRVKIPFTSYDHVLLVGEGDFSFTESLVRHHQIDCITATCFDSQVVLGEKYPGIESRIRRLSGLRDDDDDHDPQKSECHDATEQDWTGFSPSSADTRDDSHDGDQVDEIDNKEKASDTEKSTSVVVHYGIDGTKLSSSTHRKTMKQRSPFSKIVFNFPHVGGLSTDVNRQVRSNQELLVGFFNAAKPLLATPGVPTRSVRPLPPPSSSDIYSTSDENEEDDVTSSSITTTTTTTGYILVTLFEGEPYSLWNIRDLARHCGLKVVESFKFPWSAYPGYRHARTLGEIVRTTGTTTDKQDGTNEKKKKGAWRGEDRDARCYVLALKEVDGPYPLPGSGFGTTARKRQRLGDDDDDDGDDDASNNKVRKY